MANFTKAELKGHKVNIVLSDGVAWKGRVFDVETGEPIDNLRGLDIHVDMKDHVKIIATLKLVGDDYDNPQLLNVVVQTIEAQADIEVQS